MKATQKLFSRVATWLLPLLLVAVVFYPETRVWGSTLPGGVGIEAPSVVSHLTHPGYAFAYDESASESLVAPRRVGSLPAGEAPYQLKLFPDEAYSRVGHYGRTPTAQQRASVSKGMEFDHNPTLVQHYYEGVDGGLPGFNLTQTERLNHAQSLSSGAAATPAAQRAQGAAAAAYSKQQKRLWGLE